MGTTRILVLAVTALFIVTNAQAQQPAAPTPAPAPPPMDYGAPITTEQAKAAATAAIAEAKKNNWRMAFAVVGPAGELVYFEKIDGVQHASLTIAQGKARTAALYRRPSKAFQDGMAAGNNYFLSFPDLVASEGGIPLVSGGKIIGAIGASGGTGQQDGVAAKAGVDTVK